MSPVITLFCEGIKISLDYKVLSKLSMSGNVYIEPIGGKTSIHSYIQGFFSGTKITRIEYARAFRDRDFDYSVPESPELIRDHRLLISYRTTIENYLLHPRTLFDYVHASNKEPNIRERLADINACEEIFREVCNDLKFYTAARWALGETKRNIPNNFDIKSNWPYNSGALPPTMSDTDCRAMLSEIISKIKVKADRLNFADFEYQYARFIEKFDTPQFTDDISLCLVWFNGKDIASMIHRKLGGNSFFQNGQSNDYYSFALGDDYFLKALNNNEFPDLTQLRDIIIGATHIEPIP